MKFVVVENTPGYLPEDDEPARFDDLKQAQEYMREQADRYLDDPDGDFTISYGERSCFVEDNQKTYDLGRVIEIMEVEEEC